MYIGKTINISDLVRAHVCFTTTEREGTLKECISIISPAVSPGITLRATLTATNIINRSTA